MARKATSGFRWRQYAAQYEDRKSSNVRQAFSVLLFALVIATAVYWGVSSDASLPVVSISRGTGEIVSVQDKDGREIPWEEIKGRRYEKVWVK